MVSNCFFLNISTPTWGNDPTLTKYISNGLVHFHLPKNSVFRFSTYGVFLGKIQEGNAIRFIFRFCHCRIGKKNIRRFTNRRAKCAPQLGTTTTRAFRTKNGWLVWRGGFWNQHPIGSTWKFGFWRMHPEVLGFWFRIFRIDVGWFDRKSWKWS